MRRHGQEPFFGWASAHRIGGSFFDSPDSRQSSESEIKVIRGDRQEDATAAKSSQTRRRMVLRVVASSVFILAVVLVVTARSQGPGAAPAVIESESAAG